MAELVDASDSKSGISNDVQVRFLFWARPKSYIRSLTASDILLKELLHHSSAFL